MTVPAVPDGENGREIARLTYEMNWHVRQASMLAERSCEFKEKADAQTAMAEGYRAEIDALLEAKS